MTQKTYKPAVMAIAVMTLAVILAVYAIGVFSNGREGTELASLTVPSREQVEKLYAEGEFKKVVPLLNRRLRKKADDKRSKSLLASSYWQIGEHDKSYAQYEELLEKDPGNAETLYLLALLAKELDKPKTALAHMKSAADAKPDSIIFQVRLARLYQEQKEYESAWKIWETLLLEVPGDELDLPEVYFELATVHLGLDHAVEARGAVDAGLALAPKHARLLELQAQLGQGEKSEVPGSD